MTSSMFCSFAVLGPTSSCATLLLQPRAKCPTLPHLTFLSSPALLVLDLPPPLPEFLLMFLTSVFGRYQQSFFKWPGFPHWLQVT